MVHIPNVFLVKICSVYILLSACPYMQGTILMAFCDMNNNIDT